MQRLFPPYVSLSVDACGRDAFISYLSTMDYHSPHTNSARLGNHVGKTVRLWGKVKMLQGDSAIVHASDGGEVKIKIARGTTMGDSFVEVLGKVEEGNVVAMLACTNLDSDFTEADLGFYNKFVEFSENPKFRHLSQPSS